DDKQLSQRLGRATLWLLVVTLAGVVLLAEGVILALGWLFGGDPQTALTLILAAMVLPYMILICLVALLGGMLNARYHFSCPALAPVVLNVFLIIAGLWGTGLLGEDKSQKIFAVAAGVLVGGLAQLALVVVPLKRMGVSLGWLWRPQMEQIRRIIKLTAPMVLGLAVMQVNALLDYLLATWLSAEPGAVLMRIGSWEIPYPEETGAGSQYYLRQSSGYFSQRSGPLNLIGLFAAGRQLLDFSAQQAGQYRQVQGRTYRRGEGQSSRTQRPN
ncbi:unnamed protein product, partial [marine sediment metagenome]